MLLTSSSAYREHTKSITSCLVGGLVAKPKLSTSATQQHASSEPSIPSPSLSTSQSSSGDSQATGPPPAPKTVLEALEQRLEKYQSAVEDATKEGNPSKGRRMGRIVKVSVGYKISKSKSPSELAGLN